MPEINLGRVMGPAGPQGKQGPPGPAGPQGIQGPPGESAADAVTVPGGAAIEMGESLGEGPYTFEYEEDEGSAVSAVQVAYDGTASGIAADTVQGAVDALSAQKADVSRTYNPNLLDNWYFIDPINQKNIVTSTLNQYGIDRWICYNDVYTVENGYLDVHGNGVLTQAIENIAQLDGKTLTFSVLFLDGTLKTGTSKLDHKSTTFFINTQDEQYYILAGSLQFYRLTGMQLVAAKLELGDHQTLARQDDSGNWVLNDPPPNKALELAKCQRYYQTFGGRCSGLTNFLSIPLSVSMRKRPALILTAGGFLMGNSGGAHGVSSIELFNLHSNCIDVIVTTEDGVIPDGTTCWFDYNLAASADL